jgi:hypothetical protein
MPSRRSRAFDYAMRAMRRESGRQPGGASGRAAARRDRALAQRELELFRRGQGLPYWHYDRY